MKVQYAMGDRLKKRSDVELSHSSCVSMGDRANHSQWFCGYGRKALLLTSRTRRNHGRQFLMCPFFQNKAVNCGYFQWLDEVCEVVVDADSGCMEAAQTEVDEVVIRKLKRKAANLLVVPTLAPWMVFTGKRALEGGLIGPYAIGAIGRRLIAGGAALGKGLIACGVFVGEASLYVSLKGA
ncbi:hypothetical protein CDL15_Pgr025707 [Punica granatum]|uniref:GRF-type domain-containing protein n=1 Tax=Punica granatum TaxID=22663 RepID=A0A218WBM6_PUNGR|nr:hypothetical protein CDL15_Pgr025707 [Punica granatum]PKI64902.1 hypothetical protein CRG98_014698 [Punica granatum]